MDTNLTDAMAQRAAQRALDYADMLTDEEFLEYVSLLSTNLLAAAVRELDLMGVEG